MSPAGDGFNPDASAEVRGEDSVRWSLSISVLFAALGFAVLELTGNAALSISAFCLKFGLRDAATAWWLLQSDPQPGRARVCAAFYVAWAFWRVTVAAVGALIALCVLQSCLPARQGANWPWGTIALIGLGGFFSSGIVTLATTWRASRIHLKVWLSPQVRDCPRHAWPPRPTRDRRGNRLRQLYLSSAGVVFAQMLLLSAGLIAFSDHLPGQLPNHWQLTVVYIGVVLVAVVTTALLVSSFYVLRKVAAISPEECWPENAEAPEWRGPAARS